MNSRVSASENKVSIKVSMETWERERMYKQQPRSFCFQSTTFELLQCFIMIIKNNNSH